METAFVIRTLYFSACATLFTMSACMVNYFYSRKIFPGFRAWTVGSILSALAFLLIGLRQVLPDFITIVLANTIGIIAMFLFYSGFKSFAKEELNFRRHLTFIIIYSGILFPILTYVVPSLEARIAIASVVTGGYFFMCGMVHYKQGQLGFIKLNKLLITTLLLLVALRAFRAVYFFIPSNKISDLMSSGGLSGVLILLLTILSTSFIVSLMQLNSERLERENVKLIKTLQTALDEIKTLKGIIPICSYCKNIRDDKGYWEQLESYLSKHSKAEFSHGICQKCAKKYYPDIDIYEE